MKHKNFDKQARLIELNAISTFIDITLQSDLMETIKGNPILTERGSKVLAGILEDVQRTIDRMEDEQ